MPLRYDVFLCRINIFYVEHCYILHKVHGCAMILYILELEEIICTLNHGTNFYYQLC